MVEWHLMHVYFQLSNFQSKHFYSAPFSVLLLFAINHHLIDFSSSVSSLGVISFKPNIELTESTRLWSVHLVFYIPGIWNGKSWVSRTWLWYPSGKMQIRTKLTAFSGKHKDYIGHCVGWFSRSFALFFRLLSVSYYSFHFLSISR